MYDFPGADWKISRKTLSGLFTSFSVDFGKLKSKQLSEIWALDQDRTVVA